MTVAVDIDLRGGRGCHALSTDGSKVYCVSPEELLGFLLASTGSILVECASPIVYSGRIHHGQQAWAIYNSFIVGQLGILFPHRTLVAPSSVWTHKFPEKDRHALCDAKQPNHDLRECECMLWMYERHPEDWVPLPSYMEKLWMNCRKKTQRRK